MRPSPQLLKRLIRDKRVINFYSKMIAYIAILGLAAMILLADRQLGRQNPTFGTIASGLVLSIFGAVLFITFRLSRALGTARRRAQFVARACSGRGANAMSRAEAEEQWASTEAQRQTQRSSRSLLVRITRKTIRIIIIITVAASIGILVFIALLNLM